MLCTFPLKPLHIKSILIQKIIECVFLFLVLMVMRTLDAGRWVLDCQVTFQFPIPESNSELQCKVVVQTNSGITVRALRKAEAPSALLTS
jgi:hypothetical protein